MISLLRGALAAVLCVSFAAVAYGQDTPAPAITPSTPPPTPELVDRVVAIVDEEAILLSELKREIETYRFELSNAGQPMPDDEAAVRKDMLKRLIEVKLLVAQAKSDGITMSDEQLEQAVGRDLQDLIDRYGSLSGLETELARMGMTMEDLRNRHRELNRTRFFTARMVERHVRPLVEVTEGEVREYFDANREEMPATPDSLRLSNILIVPELAEGREAALLSRLGEVQKDLTDGVDFGDVARKFSDGPNAARGGELGSFSRGDLFHPSLERAAWELPIGEISHPIQTDRGIHLIQVTQRDEAVELRQIMLAVTLSEAERQAAEDEAATVAKLARDGRDFAELAKIHSDDPSAAASGGDLGFFAVDALTPAFVDALRGILVGETTAPIRGAAGWFVLKLEERRDGRRLPYDEVSERLRGFVTQQRIEAELNRFLDGLRSRYYIEVKA